MARVSVAGARFQHGHYKLCGLHHPNVPDSGKITTASLDAVDPKAATTP